MALLSVAHYYQYHDTLIEKEEACVTIYTNLKLTRRLIIQKILIVQYLKIGSSNLV